MKYLKPEATIVVKGWFRKRYYVILPSLSEFGVYELPIHDAETVAKEKVKQNAQAKRN